MKNKVVYGVPLNEDFNKGYYIGQFYLHGKAEDINGYDIVTMSGDCFYAAMFDNRASLVEIEIKEERYKGLMFSFYHFGRMEGLITLIDDLDAIKDIIKVFPINSPTIEEGEKTYLKTHFPNTYNLLK